MAAEAFHNLLEVIRKLIVQSAINMETEKNIYCLNWLSVN